MNLKGKPTPNDISNGLRYHASIDRIVVHKRTGLGNQPLTVILHHRVAALIADIADTVQLLRLGRPIPQTGVLASLAHVHLEAFSLQYAILPRTKLDRLPLPASCSTNADSTASIFSSRSKL